MMPRRSTTRKYRPSLESLETKQLLSAIPTAHGAEAIMQVTRPVAPHAELQRIEPCGTGKGIRIGTS
jgi:hypothetical protein